ncbi:MAG: Ig-like domain-containing protein [Marinifilaceae bacterium]
MAEIFNTHPVFESNQVLTSEQLNSLINYLDQQNRLTRSRLIGVGIVCGLEVNYDPKAGTITISGGTGITSEGYLISLGECITVKYRNYTLPPGTLYAPFVHPVTNEKDIDLWELLTEKADDGPDVASLKVPDDFLDDKVVLLFVESYDKDLKSCLGKSCDELGKERIHRVRKLLISVEDLQKVENRAILAKEERSLKEESELFGTKSMQTIKSLQKRRADQAGRYLGTQQKKKFNSSAIDDKLPFVDMLRVLFLPGKAHSKDYKAFSKNYAVVILKVFDSLMDALSDTYELYAPLLSEFYSNINPFQSRRIRDVKKDLLEFIRDEALNTPSYRGIQYVYDYFRDLIAAYHEFKQVSSELMWGCCSNRNKFPRHLVLGKAIQPSSYQGNACDYRNEFVQPPVYNHQRELIRKMIALHNRLVLMFESFDLDRLKIVLAKKEEFPIKITPSSEKSSPLGMRSIPWYYNPNQESSFEKLGRLKDYWYHDATRGCSQEADALILSYDDQSVDQSKPKDKLSTPLYYDTQGNSFLRIEGYLGKRLEEVMDRINLLKDQFNLSFQIMALQLNPDTGKLKPDYSCGFEDLQEEYRMARANFLGIIHDLKVLYEYVEENRKIIFQGEEDEKEKDLMERSKVLLDLLSKMCSTMKECLREFDFLQYRENYKEILKYIIDFFLVETYLPRKLKMGDRKEQLHLINGLIQRIMPLGYRFTDFLFYNKFFRIYHSFKRRESYLPKESVTFSTFLSKHPGIDHQAGVSIGGTFILVYEDSAEKEVLADFSLPYICCEEKLCVPMCDKKDFVLNVPPFARPDYAVTMKGHWVDIDVGRNDYQVGNGISLQHFDETSEKKGTISRESKSNVLRYQPQSNFSGVDTFTYTLINRKTKQTDTASVTILVMEKCCYSVEILQCWGDEAVKKALELRGINYSRTDDIYKLLLTNLRKTAGFTEKEIRGGVLESADWRRKLLSCLGIKYSRSTSYEQLGQLIEKYQDQNCQESKPKPGVMVDVGLLTKEEIVKVLEARGSTITAEESKTKVENEFKASTGGATLTESELMLLTKDKLMYILDEKEVKYLKSDNKTELVGKLMK